MFGLALLSGLTACATVDAPLLDQDAHERALSRTNRLGVGDKLKISVFGENNLSGSYDVDARGVVSFPLVGSVPARGLSVHQFRRKLQAKLSNGYLVDPKITVEIQNFRPLFVHGEVRNGGEYAYKVGTRLKDAIAVAGGFTYRANERYLLLTREGSREPVRVDIADNIVVLPGDNIRVLERFF